MVIMGSFTSRNKEQISLKKSFLTKLQRGSWLYCVKHYGESNVRLLSQLKVMSKPGLTHIGPACTAENIHWVSVVSGQLWPNRQKVAEFHTFRSWKFAQRQKFSQRTILVQYWLPQKIINSKNTGLWICSKMVFYHWYRRKIADEGQKVFVEKTCFHIFVPVVQVKNIVSAFLNDGNFGIFEIDPSFSSKARWEQNKKPTVKTIYAIFELFLIRRPL